MADVATAGREWLNAGEITREVLSREPATNTGTIHATVRYHCINDPSKKHSPGRQFRTNPLFVTDAPTVHGKRYRLLTPGERQAFLSNVRDDLELVSYAQTMEWLGNTSVPLDTHVEDEEVDASAEPEEVTGMALLELHLQDYIHRHWKSVFPSFVLYRGGEGREFRTYEPSVGIVDFLCTDKQGDFVVIETKRDMPDRKAIGQILGYMGWVGAKLCDRGQKVKGILMAGEPSEELQLAVRPVPGLSLYTYQISFAIEPVHEAMQPRRDPL
jgi:hypothetical protein